VELKKMCIFNLKVLKVKNTKIFVSKLTNSKQITIYANEVELSLFEETPRNAMILPVFSKEEEEIELINLENYENLFDDLGKLFPIQNTFGSFSTFSNDFLKVMEVGSYSVSIAQNIEELKKINPKIFKLSENVDKILSKHYKKNFKFIVCLFNTSKKVNLKNNLTLIVSSIRLYQLNIPQ
jgi:hypothetical protein